jgi:large subunit ribosomal protein L1
MAKLTKNRKVSFRKIEQGKLYTLTEAAVTGKRNYNTKFDASVDMNVRLGVDPRKANQMVRGSSNSSSWYRKETRVLVLCTPDKEEEAKMLVLITLVLTIILKKSKGGWTDVDVIITMPPVMAKVGAGTYFRTKRTNA